MTISGRISPSATMAPSLAGPIRMEPSLSQRRSCSRPASGSWASRALQRSREMTQVCSREMVQTVESDLRADFAPGRQPGRLWRTGTWPRAAHGGAVKDGRSPPPRGASVASVLDGAEYADHLRSTAVVLIGRVTPGPSALVAWAWGSASKNAPAAEATRALGSARVEASDQVALSPSPPRNDGPSILTVWHWWRSRLSSAPTSALLPRKFAHSE